MYRFHAFFEDFRSGIQSVTGWVAYLAVAAFVVGMPLKLSQ